LYSLLPLLLLALLFAALQVCWAFSRCLMTPHTTAALLSLPQVGADCDAAVGCWLVDCCIAVRHAAHVYCAVSCQCAGCSVRAEVLQRLLLLLLPLLLLLLLLLLQVVPYLVDLLQDSCMAVRRMAGACLDAVMDSNKAAAGGTWHVCVIVALVR
jgi:hypothetical protein